MIDSTLLIFLHNLQCRNRCLRNFVLQTHYTIIPKSTLLQNLLGFLIFVERPRGDQTTTLNGNNPILVTQLVFQNFFIYSRNRYFKSDFLAYTIIKNVPKESETKKPLIINGFSNGIISKYFQNEKNIFKMKNY